MQDRIRTPDSAFWEVCSHWCEIMMMLAAPDRVVSLADDSIDSAFSMYLFLADSQDIADLSRHMANRDLQSLRCKMAQLAQRAGPQAPNEIYQIKDWADRMGQWISRWESVAASLEVLTESDRCDLCLGDTDHDSCKASRLATAERAAARDSDEAWTDRPFRLQSRTVDFSPTYKSAPTDVVMAQFPTGSLYPVVILPDGSADPPARFADGSSTSRPASATSYMMSQISLGCEKWAHWGSVDEFMKWIDDGIDAYIT